MRWRWRPGYLHTTQKHQVQRRPSQAVGKARSSLELEARALPAVKGQGGALLMEEVRNKGYGVPEPGTVRLSKMVGRSHEGGRLEEPDLANLHSLLCPGGATAAEAGTTKRCLSRRCGNPPVPPVGKRGLRASKQGNECRECVPQASIRWHRSAQRRVSVG